jgi:hypothetical protein
MKPGSLKMEDIQVAQNHHDYVNKALAEAKGKYKAFVVLKNADREPYEHVTQIDAMMAALQNRVPTINGYTTVVDPAFYWVHEGNRQGVQTWLHHCQVDTLLSNQTILFIP